VIVGLGSTTDPVVLVPGSVEALHADADDLDRQGRDLADAGQDVRRRTVASWFGGAAGGWAQRRAVLSESLAAVRQVYPVTARMLRAHAQVLVWARGRAQVAIGLWSQASVLSSTTDTQCLRPTLTLGLRPAATSAFGRPVPALVTDPGAGTRALAEQVLAAARQEVALSAQAAAAVLDELSDGLPDGRWHADQFLAGIGDWVVGIGTLLYKFNQIRLVIDPLGVRDDVVEIGTGLAATGQYLVANPGDAPAVLFDTRTMHDNPARWWGGLAPDIALTVVAGAGFATRALGGVRTGARVAEELTDASRVGSRWDDVAARAQMGRRLAQRPGPPRPDQPSRLGPVPAPGSGGR